MLTPLERRIAWLHKLCEERGVSFEDVMGRSRLARHCIVRSEAYVKFRNDGWSLPAIGRFFDRDHTTVLSGINYFMRKLNGKHKQVADLGPHQQA